MKAKHHVLHKLQLQYLDARTEPQLLETEFQPWNTKNYRKIKSFNRQNRVPLYSKQKEGEQNPSFLFRSIPFQVMS
jgi:hypothetical protein